MEGFEEYGAVELEANLRAKLERRVDDLSQTPNTDTPRPRTFAGPTRQDAPLINARRLSAQKHPLGPHSCLRVRG